MARNAHEKRAKMAWVATQVKRERRGRSESLGNDPSKRADKETVVNRGKEVDGGKRGGVNGSTRRRTGNGEINIVAKEKLVVTRTTFRALRHRRRRSSSAPARPDRHRLLEDHYLVDTSEHVVLPGVPKHGDDFRRDVHDYFNLIILLPVVVLNLMNWNWDILLNQLGNKAIRDSWVGEWFYTFYWVTVSYFVVDLLWILVFPTAVRSPGTIIQHHVATLCYLVIPYIRPEYQWCMGACMSVEINTWFLIARRVFNKQGFPPWIIDLPPFFSIRVKLISVLFYLTWISVRCILYPWMAVAFANEWLTLSHKVGTKVNVLAIVLPLHSIFCILNIKWSYDLLMSKIRWWRKKGNKQQMVSKGL